MTRYVYTDYADSYYSRLLEELSVEEPDPDDPLAGAACRDYREDADELFFAPDGEKAAARMLRVSAAKAVCATCKVRPVCLEMAYAQGEKHGVWGGEDFVQVEKKRARAAKKAAEAAKETD